MASKKPTVYETSSCQYCDKLDNDYMVQCDLCDLWYHFSCVGVDSTVASRDWNCDSCKFAFPKRPSLNNQDKENQPSNYQWRKTKSIRTLTSISSGQCKALALQRLDEERALIAKRDSEYLQKKYSILEGSIDEFVELGEREHNKGDEGELSFQNTLRWTKEINQLSKDFSSKFNAQEISISLNDDERTAFRQRFIPQAQSSTNMRRSKSVIPSAENVCSSNPFLEPDYMDEPEKPKEFQQPLLRENIFMSHDTNEPFQSTNCGHVRFNATEVSRPLQSEGINKSFIVNESETVKGNLIQPSKFRLSDERQSSATNFNFGAASLVPPDQSKKTFADIASNRTNTVNNSNWHSLHSTTTVQPKAIFEPDQMQAAPQRNEFRSSTIRNVPPKMDFDKFSFSTIKQPQMQPNEQVNPNAQVNSMTTSGRVQNSNLGHQSTVHQPTVHQPTIHQPTVHQSMDNQSTLRRSNTSRIGQLVDYQTLCQPYVQLTPNQIAARHTMNKRYPLFFGEPTKWQMFESAFVNATESCGLSNAENLSRLLDCLKGDAMDNVQCRLLHPDSVPGVMETLRLMFGRPELIIQKLLDGINKTTAPKSDDLGSLVKFAISVQNLCSTVQSFNAVQHLQNPMLIKALTDKLPSQIQLNWAFYKQNAGNVTLATLGDWLYGLATIASDVVTIDDSKNDKKVRKEDNFKNSKSENYINSANSSRSTQATSNTGAIYKNQKKCPACNRAFCKTLAFCEQFKKLTRQDKWKLVKSSNFCGCCLGNHRYFSCKQKVQCGVAGCSLFHHVLLHNETIDAKVNDRAKQNSSTDDSQNKTCNSMTGMYRQPKFPEIFRIVPVKLFCNEKWKKIYVYFDDGSNLTTIALSVAQKLGLRGTKESLCVKWSFGETQVEADSNRVSVRISGVHNGAETFCLDDVRTVKELKLPKQSITADWLSQYPYLDGIPISTYKDAVPQMIIGLRFSKLMVSLETIEGNWEQPIACRTRLGWVIQGPNDVQISTNSSTKFGLNMCECQSSLNRLHQLVKDFFSLESFGVKLTDNVIASKAMKRARYILESSTVKNGNHYVAALLWRSDDVKLPNSFEMAKRRLECVESKIKKNPILANRMSDYFNDFLDKGYIRKLTLQEQQRHGPHTWYLPVFPVFNAKKPEKLRVVWDGAAKVNGISLNSQLLAGPDQLIPLPDILRRFREASIGLCTDIIEMFHRVFVNEEDQDSQRFLWRDGDVDREPDVFVVNVLPFGLTCSPAIAQFVKNKNAETFKEQYPKAVEAIKKSHYVDDMIERAHDVESAVQLIKNVQFIHRHANFDLRNLISNNREVLEAINGSPEFSDKILVDKLDVNIERILGMFWNTKTDTFTYSLQFLKLKNLAEERCPTKREVLRIVMSVFDPLGFLTHLLIQAKVLLQEIWRTKITWDVPIPHLLALKWSRWVDHLLQVETLHIPRFYSPRMSPQRPQSIQLHVFVDASLDAYATVAYFRIENDTGVDSSLIGAKSRVAPIKPISVPRLELQGSLLGNRFAESILQSHSTLDIEKTIIWCDSKTVLFWLVSEPRRYSQFVAFRIGEILDTKHNFQWRWIPSEFNVADDATKTKDLPELQSSSRWFLGPEFLRDANSDFSFELDEPDFTTDEEVRPYYLLTHLEVPVSKLIDYERFSNWQRLVRTMAYVLRFIRNVKVDRQRRNIGTFSSNDILVI